MRSFELYDLKVSLKEVRGDMFTQMKYGDYLLVRGENIYLPENTGFSMYVLAAIIPLLPAKQRELDDNDWMNTDFRIAGPDANCGAVFHIERIGKTKFYLEQVSGENLTY